MNQNQRDAAWRILDIVLSVAVVAMLGVIAFNTRTLIAHGERLANIEASIFTLDEKREIRAEMSVLKADLIRSSQSPPAWFVDRVDKLELKLEAINAHLVQIDKSIQ